MVVKALTMIGFRQHQLLVAAQLAGVMVVCGLAYWMGPGWFSVPGDTSTTGRIEFLAPWLLIPALAVFACTLVTMCYRYFSPDSIDGTPRPESRFLEINLRVTQNTLEQAFLAAVAWFGLAMTLVPERLTLIPVLAVLFAAGRLTFWIGYHFSPKARAFGFGLTALPTAIALLFLGWRMLIAA